jgi:Leucine-rich repeat (LRR) protein
VEECLSNDSKGLLPYFEFLRDDEDKFPTELKDVKGILELNLAGIDEIPSKITGFSDIENVSLNSASLKEFPSILLNLEKLKKLEMDNVEIKNLPDDFSGFEKIA